VTSPTETLRDVQDVRTSLLRDFVFEVLAPVESAAPPRGCVSRTTTTLERDITSSG
jgi:hypothetical protein